MRFVIMTPTRQYFRGWGKKHAGANWTRDIGEALLMRKGEAQAALKELLAKRFAVEVVSDARAGLEHEVSASHGVLIKNKAGLFYAGRRRDKTVIWVASRQQARVHPTSRSASAVERHLTGTVRVPAGK